MPKGHYLTEAVKDAIWELRAEGLSDREIAPRRSTHAPSPATGRAIS
jgi:hypothetical protein